MTVEDTLRKGLTSTPKYLPVWYRYDKQGSIYNDKCLTDNPYYYLYEAEMSVFNENVEEVVKQVPSPCVLVEMGSGNSEKSRIFIDAILEQQATLQYMPVDISKEFLEETCEKIAKDYGNKLDVQPIAGDYSVGFEQMRHIKGNKIILWLGGGFQNEAYRVQIGRVESLARTMTGNDRLIISLDITQNSQEIENSYLDPLAGLGISVTLEKGEYIDLFEGEGVSCKYTLQQIEYLVKAGNQTVHRVWTDPKQHVAVCCVGKEN